MTGLLVGVVGCVNGKLPVYVFPLPQSFGGPPLLDEDIRNNLGRIGLVTGQAPPHIEAASPGIRIADIPPACRPWSTACLLLAIDQLYNSEYQARELSIFSDNTPQDHSQPPSEFMQVALAPLGMQATLRDHLEGEIRQQTDMAVVTLKEEGPKGKDDKPTFSHIRGKGLNTILEVNIQTLKMHPPLGFYQRKPWKSILPPGPARNVRVDVRTRVVDVDKGEELFFRKFSCFSPFRSRQEWGVTDAEPFLSSLNLCYQHLSKKIVEEIFLIYAFPKAGGQI